MKIIKKGKEKIKDDFFILGFDEIKSFTNYFPAGNIEKIMEKIEKKYYFQIKGKRSTTLRLKHLKKTSLKSLSPEISPTLDLNTSLIKIH